MKEIHFNNGKNIIFDVKRRRDIEGLGRFFESGGPTSTEQISEAEILGTAQKILEAQYDDNSVQHYLSNLRQELQSDMGVPIAVVMQALSSARDNVQFNIYLQDNSLSREDLPRLLNESALNQITQAMAHHPVSYKKELGLIFSHVSEDELDSCFKTPLKPVIDDKTHLTAADKEDYLCEKAEPNLSFSLRHGAVLSVDQGGEPAFLVKYAGRKAALSLKPVMAGDGKMMMPGNWYLPASIETGKTLSAAFSSGKKRIEMPPGEWKHIRELQSAPGEDDGELFERARRTAHSINGRIIDPNIVVNGEPMTRSIFRRRFRKR